MQSKLLELINQSSTERLFLMQGSRFTGLSSFWPSPMAMSSGSDQKDKVWQVFGAPPSGWERLARGISDPCLIISLAWMCFGVLQEEPEREFVSSWLSHRLGSVVCLLYTGYFASQVDRWDVKSEVSLIHLEKLPLEAFPAALWIEEPFGILWAERRGSHQSLVLVAMEARSDRSKPQKKCKKKRQRL